MDNLKSQDLQSNKNDTTEKQKNNIEQLIFQIGAAFAHAPQKNQDILMEKEKTSKIWAHISAQQWMQQMHPWCQRPDTFARYLIDKDFARHACTAWCTIAQHEHLSVANILTHPFAGLEGFRDFWKNHPQWKSDPLQFTNDLQQWLVEKNYLTDNMDMPHIWNAVQIAKGLNIPVDQILHGGKRPTTDNTLDISEMDADPQAGPFLV